jgi:hypothetical protein
MDDVFSDIGTAAGNKCGHWWDRKANTLPRSGDNGDA